MNKVVKKKLRRSGKVRESDSNIKYIKCGVYNSEREGITIKPPFVNLTLNLPH